MNKGLTNIDIVFRNGLKDYEVLPPPDVWDKLKPSIRTRRRPLVLLRTAALIAVLITISFLSNRQVREITG